MKDTKRKKSRQQWIGALFYMLIGAASGILIVRFTKQLTGEASAGKKLFLFLTLLVSVYAAMLIHIHVRVQALMDRFHLTKNKHNMGQI